MDVEPDGATWRKSSYSNGTGGECVEVATLPSGRAVRDSKHPEGPILVFTKGGWQAFVKGIQAGELCAELEPGKRQAFVAKVQVMTPHSLSAWAAVSTRTVVLHACTE